MEYPDIIDYLKVLTPVFIGVFSWYMWSLSQKFMSKVDFEKHKKDYKDLEQKIFSNNKEIYSIQTELKQQKKDLEDIKEITANQEAKISKQNEDIVEIKTYIKHISESLVDIKEYLFKRKRTPHN